jgi:hypothetical protein
MVANGFYQIMSKLLQQYVISHNMLPLIRQLPETQNVSNITQDKVVLLQLFTALSVRPVQYTSGMAAGQFMRNIMSVPLLSQRLPTSLYPTYVNMLPILLATNPSSVSGTTTENLYLLGNLLGLSKMYILFLENSKNEKSKNAVLLSFFVKWISALTKSNTPILKSILQSNDPGNFVTVNYSLILFLKNILYY